MGNRPTIPSDLKSPDTIQKPYGFGPTKQTLQFDGCDLSDAERRERGMAEAPDEVQKASSLVNEDDCQVAYDRLNHPSLKSKHFKFQIEKVPGTSTEIGHYQMFNKDMTLHSYHKSLPFPAGLLTVKGTPKLNNVTYIIKFKKTDEDASLTKYFGKE